MKRLCLVILLSASVVVAAPKKPLDEVDTLASEGKIVAAVERAKALEDSLSKRKTEQAKAKKRREDLEKRVAMLKVEIAGAQSIEIDGRPFSAPEMPLDPGRHKLVVRSSKGVQIAEDVSLAEGEHRTFQTSFPKEEVVAPPPRAVEPPTAAPNRLGTVGWVLGGVGVATLGVGGYFGYRAMSANDDLAAKCPNVRCAPEYQGLQDDRNFNATLSTVLVAGGVALVATGIVLIVTSKGRSADTRGTAPTVFSF
jgi:hypothetical protein